MAQIVETVMKHITGFRHLRDKLKKGNEQFNKRNRKVSNSDPFHSADIL